MDILSSIEVRWFVEATSTEAAAARAWFDGVEAQGRREDRYLLTGRSDIGFKARVEDGRPAKVETKYMTGSLGPALLHERFVGHIERWRKLSLDANDPELQQATPPRAGHEWVRIEKKRKLRKLAYEGGVVRAVDVMDNPRAGCGVEVTELVVDISGDVKRAVSVGLEAFGPENELLTVLLRVCPTAFELAAGLRLGFAQSASYPSWLAELTRGT
jgi:hypothetical protein